MQPTSNINGSPGASLNVDDSQTFDRTYLVNKLNYIDFIGGIVRAVFVHAELGHERVLSLSPLPCAGPDLICRRTGQASVDPKLFRFAYLLVDDTAATLLVHAELIELGDDALRLRLPETCHPLHHPLPRPRINPALGVEIFQKGVRYTGRLTDYAEGCLDIAVDFTPPQSRHWIDPEEPVYLVLLEGTEPCFSGACVIVSRKPGRHAAAFRLRAEDLPFRRYRPKKYRSKRVHLSPPPQVVFTHPLNLQTVSSRILDLSGMGFSFTADGRDTDLFTGLILSGVRLELAGEPLATCKAQVVYRSRTPDATAHPVYRYGLAILDMDVADHTHLQRVVQQALDPNAYVNGRVSQQALWAFFFETGFIYPQKYEALGERKSAIQKTYRKLYLDQPSFSRHFIYQKQGTILGHMAMLRVYDKAWLIHHHAARSHSDAGAGLRVMEQIGQFVNESHSLRAIRMEYIFFFYRPENRFPSLLFGKAARFVNDARICSLDRFAYGHFHRPPSPAGDLPDPWSLSPARVEDLEIFNAFYDQKAGGLMAEAFDLTGESSGFDSLVEEYRSIGFQRERRLVSLKRAGRLKVFFEINLSDIGLNMSDLTNCIRFFVIDGSGLDREILDSALGRLAQPFDGPDVPILIFPDDAAAFSPVPIERHYLLWVYNLRYTDRYFAFMNRIIRFSRAGEKK